MKKEKETKKLLQGQWKSYPDSKIGLINHFLVFSSIFAKTMHELNGQQVSFRLYEH